jgi:hypothetical protein
VFEQMLADGAVDAAARSEIASLQFSHPRREAEVFRKRSCALSNTQAASERKF